MNPDVDQVVEAIDRYRYRYATEDELQKALAAALTESGWPVMREARLDRYSRLDLLVGDPLEGPSVAVEVKVGGGRAQALRQVQRYVGYDEVSGLVLVTARVAHAALPLLVHGKPVRVVQLAMQGL